MKLSIIIPVYNEEKTVTQLLERVIKVKFKDVEREIIVVEDGSSDDTKKKIQTFVKTHSVKGFKVFYHKKNSGKGAAVRTGIEKANGEYIIIQDADLEYDPQQIVKLTKPILEKRAQVVYGTRLDRLPDFKGEQKTLQSFVHYVGNKFLSLVTSIIYLYWITDMETCYKLFPKKAAPLLKLKARGFEFEPEITAKLLKNGYKIYELPISITPRGYNEGKKISTFKDGFRACWYLLKYRFVD
jgi:dolichol-phosphate mannosyltransferase